MKQNPSPNNGNPRIALSNCKITMLYIEKQIALLSPATGDVKYLHELNENMKEQQNLKSELEKYLATAVPDYEIPRR